MAYVVLFVSVSLGLISVTIGGGIPAWIFSATMFGFSTIVIFHYISVNIKESNPVLHKRIRNFISLFWSLSFMLTVGMFLLQYNGYIKASWVSDALLLLGFFVFVTTYILVEIFEAHSR